MKKLNDSEESDYEEDEEEDDDNDDSDGSSPERADSGLFINKKGIMPKGKEKYGSKAKEMLSFIAYPSAIENSCKLFSQNKNLFLSEEQGRVGKNRVFMSSNYVMSTKTHAQKEI